MTTVLQKSFKGVTLLDDNGCEHEFVLNSTGDSYHIIKGKYTSKHIMVPTERMLVKALIGASHGNTN